MIMCSGGAAAHNHVLRVSPPDFTPRAVNVVQILPLSLIDGLGMRIIAAMLPLTRRAKMLMLFQSTICIITLTGIAGSALNILAGSH
jgi:hypothetical protein